MFPEDVEEYLTNEEILEENANATTFNGKSFLFDFEKGDFVYKNGNLVEVTGIVALKIWIEKLIRTEKFKFKIFEDVDYGVSISDLVGSTLPHGFIEAELKRELTEAILKNPMIEDLTNWKFEKDGGKWTIYFTVETADEAFGMEVAA